MYTKEELGFILYNNRSVNGVVSNFLPNINPHKLIELEKDFDKIKESYFIKKMVSIDMSQLLIEEPDELLTPEQLSEIGPYLVERIGKFSESEMNYLTKRGFDENVIRDLSLIGLSQIEDREVMRRIGATCHPILLKFLSDGIEGGGIVIPLFKDGVLVNCTTRKITIENTDKKTLKYSLACPDISIWGIDEVNMGDEIWITEGVFDYLAIKYMGKKSISCSGGMWSSLQIYQLLDKKPSKIIILCDNDEVGFRTSSILRDLFNFYNIENETLSSKFAKDPSEHLFQMKKSIDDFDKIDITREMIFNKGDDSFDFINHLKNRKF